MERVRMLFQTQFPGLYPVKCYGSHIFLFLFLQCYAAKNVLTFPVKVILKLIQVYCLPQRICYPRLRLYDLIASSVDQFCCFCRGFGISSASPTYTTILESTIIASVTASADTRAISVAPAMANFDQPLFGTKARWFINLRKYILGGEYRSASNKTPCD